MPYLKKHRALVVNAVHHHHTMHQHHKHNLGNNALLFMVTRAIRDDKWVTKVQFWYTACTRNSRVLISGVYHIYKKPRGLVVNAVHHYHNLPNNALLLVFDNTFNKS